MPSSEESQLEEIQRLLGRNLLRLQQYERLFKALWVDQEVAGTPSEWLQARNARFIEIRTKTLGQTRDRLVSSFFRAEGQEADDSESTPTATAPSGSAHLAFRQHVVMPQEAYAQFLEDTKALVELRNELVHHLLEKHDLSIPEGREACIRYLQECLEVVGLRRAELLSICEANIKAREELAAWTRTKEFENLLVHGILPDGSFNWEDTGIVGWLRAAANALSRPDGWTPLERAIEHITAGNRDQKPKVYGCVSWQQVLSESRLFEFRYERSESGRKKGLYRPRPGK